MYTHFVGIWFLKYFLAVNVIKNIAAYMLAKMYIRVEFVLLTETECLKF